MIFLNKKGVSELTSFIFITLLVVIAATSAYLISINYIEDSLGNLDREKMENVLKKMKYDTQRLTTFTNTTVSYPVSFNTGGLIFNNNQIIYQSAIEFEDTNTFCFNGVCYQGINGFERMYLNLTSPYNFDRNISLQPGSYIIIFTNDKAQNEVTIRFR